MNSNPAVKSAAGPLARLQRARAHLAKLEAELQAFWATNPNQVGTKRNPETRQLIYYLVSANEPPISIAILAGEVLQHLRSALDHLAYQLVMRGTGQPGPFTYVYFPIFNSADEYEAKKMRQIKGMRQDAIDAIDALRPTRVGVTRCGCSTG